MFATIQSIDRDNDSLKLREDNIAEVMYNSIISKNIIDDNMPNLKQSYTNNDTISLQYYAQHIAKKYNIDSILKHNNQYHFWMVANVDEELARYYRWMIDRNLLNITMVKNHGIKKPNKEPHISVIRGLNDLLHLDIDYIKNEYYKFNNKEVSFEIDVNVKNFSCYHTTPGLHYSYTVISDDLKNIRKHFGHNEDNYHFHLTVGRTYDR